MTEHQLPTKCDVVVIGAGLSGLTAARALTVAGRDVHVIEASNGLGGRVRTDEVDGLLLDRGFQLYNPAYSEGIHILDLQALELQPLTAGVVVSIDGRHYKLGNPLSEPTWLADSLTAPTGSIRKKLAFARYAASLAVGKHEPDAIDQRSDAFLNFKFGKDLTQKVLRPFLAGVFLEDELATSKRFLDIVLESFVKGTPSVPKYGMQEIPRQLATQLLPNTVHGNVTVTELGQNKVVTTAGTIECRAVIVATDARAAATLVPSLKVPKVNAVTTWYHVADCDGKELTDGNGVVVVDGKRYSSHVPDPKRPLVNTVVMSNAAPSYASNGRTLVASSALGVHDSVYAESLVRSHLASLYCVPTSGWQHVATYPIPDALPAMLPPHELTQEPRLGHGVYLAGDYREVSSINGAFASGRRAAEAVIVDGL